MGVPSYVTIQMPTIYSSCSCVSSVYYYSVMYRTEEASDPLNNKLVRQSLLSFSTIVGTGN